MGRKSNGKSSSDESSGRKSSSPKDLKEKKKESKNRGKNKPTVKTVEETNVTVSIERLPDSKIVNTSNRIYDTSNSNNTSNNSRKELDRDLDFSKIEPPPEDDVMDLIDLDDYVEDNKKKKTPINRNTPQNSRSGRGKGKKRRRSTEEESEEEDNSLHMYGAIDKASAELEEMSIQGIGRRSIEWLKFIDTQRIKSSSLNGKVSGDMRVSIARLKYAVSLMVARSGAGGDPLYLTKKNNDLKLLLEEEKSKYAELKLKTDLLDREYAEFRRDVAIKSLEKKKESGNKIIYTKSNKYDDSACLDSPGPSSRKLKSHDAMGESWYASGQNESSNNDADVLKKTRDEISLTGDLEINNHHVRPAYTGGFLVEIHDDDCIRPQGLSAIDVTWASSSLANIIGWTADVETETLSDHIYIYICVNADGSCVCDVLSRATRRTSEPFPRWRTGSVNEDMLRANIVAGLWNEENLDELSWWNDEIADLRRSCIIWRRRYTHGLVRGGSIAGTASSPPSTCG